MVCLFAFLPGFAFQSTGSYGKIFKMFGQLEILAFVTCFVIYIVNFIRKAKIISFKSAFAELKFAVFGFFKKNKHALMLLGMFVLVVVSFIVSDNKARTLSGTDARPDGLFMHVVFAILFVFSAFIKNKTYKKIVIGIYVANFVFLCFIMIQQYYGIIGTRNAKYCPEWAKFLYNFYDKLDIRAGHFYAGETGTFQNLNHMGYYISICSMICTALFIKSKKVLSNILTGALCVLAYWAMVVNNTFGAFLAVSFSLVFFALLLWKKSNFKKIKPFVPLAIFIAVCIGVSLIPYKDSKNLVIGNFITLGNDAKNIADGSEEASKAGSGRWPRWVATVEMIKEKPVLGYGPDNLTKAYKNKGLKGVERAHCEIIERAVSTGIPSAVLYIGAILYIIVKGIRKKDLLSEKDDSLVFLMAIVSYSISALFGVFMYYTACHYFIVMGLMSSAEEKL